MKTGFYIHRETVVNMKALLGKLNIFKMSLRVNMILAIRVLKKVLFLQLLLKTYVHAILWNHNSKSTRKP